MKFSNIAALAAVLVSAASCSLFAIDNYDGPKETICGRVVDVNTGEPVLTEQNSNGIRVRLTELSYGEGVQHNPDFYCKDDGTYRNTKIFEGNYNVRIDGPFIPLYREDKDGNLIDDCTVTTDIKGVCTVNFNVQPFLKVEFVDEPTVRDGKINAKIKVTRATTVEEFKDAVVPMGGYQDYFTNVTDVRLFVSYSSTVNSANKHEPWCNVINYSGNSFESNFGKPVPISSNGTLISGSKVYVRAAARINYDTPAGTGTRRYNFSEVKEVFVP
ncbi:MAG: DUF3823 domain-containing protein [Bacteroidales bacterium]|nr:DUF3823 domain-containing protein [Bacteroidales bacterium]